MDDYLSKPFNLDQLHTVLLRWLPSKSMTDSPTDTILKTDNKWEGQRRDRADSCTSMDGADRTCMPDSSLANRIPHQELFDRKVLDTLRAPGRNGEPSLLVRVILLYMENSPKLMENLRQAIKAGDASTMRNAAHSLKSASGTFGAMMLVELCGELESMGSAGTTAGSTSLLSVLEEVYEKVCEALAKELEDSSSR